MPVNDETMHRFRTLRDELRDMQHPLYRDLDLALVLRDLAKRNEAIYRNLVGLIRGVSLIAEGSAKR